MSRQIAIWVAAGVLALTSGCAEPAQLGGLGVFNPHGFEGRVAMADQVRTAPPLRDPSRPLNPNETATSAGSNSVPGSPNVEPGSPNVEPGSPSVEQPGSHAEPTDGHAERAGHAEPGSPNVEQAGTSAEPAGTSAE